MSRQKIYGIDLDGVCADFVNPFRRWLNYYLQMDLSEDDITSYYWYETTEVTKEDFDREFELFGLNKGYRELPILPGTLDALNAINDRGDKIIYITNRPLYVFDCTKVFLEKNNFPQRENLVFADGHKSPHIKEHAVDVFIDDSPHTLGEITVGTRAEIYCRDQPYNRHMDDTFMTRVRNWYEFMEKENLCVAS